MGNGGLKCKCSELVELVTDALSCNPYYTDQVTAIMEKLKQITRGKGGESENPELLEGEND